MTAPRGVPGRTWPRDAIVLAAGALALSAPGCGESPDPYTGTRIREGSPAEPTRIQVVLPTPDDAGLRALVAAREEWAPLREEMFTLASPGAHPQALLDPDREAASRRAIEDLVEPLAGVEVGFGIDPRAAHDERVAALVTVELVPGEIMWEERGADAYTHTTFTVEPRYIRRAVIHLPDWLLDHDPDDLANFVAHEFGHALGQADHLVERDPAARDETWFWDRAMSSPIPLGQPWQPATSEDILAIAQDRYTLRDGWIDTRVPRFVELRPYRERPHPG